MESSLAFLSQWYSQWKESLLPVRNVLAQGRFLHRVSSGWVTAYSNSSFSDTILSWKFCHPVTVECKARAAWAGTTTDTSLNGDIFSPRSLFNVNWALVLKCWINQEALESNYCQVCWRDRWYFKTTEETDQEFCMGCKSIGNSSSFPCRQIPGGHATVSWDTTGTEENAVDFVL